MITNLKFQFLVLFLLVNLNLHASKLDSLLTELAEMSDVDSAKEIDKKSILCNDIAICYQELGKADQARAYFLQSIFFVEKGINSFGEWNAQAYYDMGYLYSNLATFESTINNISQAIIYLNLGEQYLKKLSSLLEAEEYRPIISHFYKTSFVIHFHADSFEKAEKYINQAIFLTSDKESENMCNLLRMKGELFQKQGAFEKAFTLYQQMFEILNLSKNKVLSQETYINSILTNSYNSGQYEAILYFMQDKAPYNNLETLDAFFSKHNVGSRATVLTNLFIYAYANMQVYEKNEDINLVLKAFKIQKIAFRLAEEFTLQSNAEKLGSYLSSPKNKAYGIIITYLNLVNNGLAQEVDVLEIIRILDVLQSTRLHVERISYAVNSEFWEQEKKLKNELIYTNIKLREAISSGGLTGVVDSLHQRSYAQSIELQRISQQTKRESVLAEYNLERKKYFDALTQFAKAEKKSILTYFHEPNKDSVFIFCVTTDSSFIVASPIDSCFDDEIKELYRLNSNLQFNQSAIDRQTALNRKFYDYLLAPLKPFLSEDLLILPLYEISYISFDALINPSGKYAVTEHTFQYTTSLYSAVTPQRRKNNNAEFLIFKPVNFGTDTLATLTHASKEVQLISESYPSIIYTDSSATKRNFLKHSDSRGVIHIASHSIINFEKPYESFILFDAAGSSYQLHAYEIFSKTINADLVTLSSCNSGNGEIEEGIGIVSLANAFYFSGVPATISSLWSAQDKSSADLMVGFYETLGTGKPKSKSLQLAKLNYLKSSDKIRQQPFFWANYVLYGSDAPIGLTLQEFNTKPLIFGGIILMLFIIFLLKRRHLKKDLR